MKKILVIEDTADIRHLIAEMLESRGFEVHLAEDGIKGVNLAETTAPDLILCDIQMPRMNGFEVLQKLRDKEITATIPFIFLTGAADKMQVRQGMELGADDYLTKPFTLQELLAAVSARLETRATLAKAAEKKLADLRDSITFSLPHEFITPLNGILGFSSMLLENARSLSTQEVEEFGGYIRDSALRLQRITENFLLYSQLELAAREGHKAAAPNELLPVMERISTITVRKAKEAGREQDLELSVDDVRTGIDPAHLEKITGELTDNAFKFSARGTLVTVKARKEASYFSIAITNLGRGLTQSEIGELGAHAQLHRRTFEQQGSGLGLAIARRLTEMHGGALHIRSHPGVSITVEVRIPLAEVISLASEHR
jgi:two-component system sensor histidine kinase/response regulator